MTMHQQLSSLNQASPDTPQPLSASPADLSSSSLCPTSSTYYHASSTSSLSSTSSPPSSTSSFLSTSLLSASGLSLRQTKCTTRMEEASTSPSRVYVVEDEGQEILRARQRPRRRQKHRLERIQHKKPEESYEDTLYAAEYGEGLTGWVLRITAAIIHMVDIAWGFTESDFSTFVIPNTMFGLLGAFAKISLLDGAPTSTSMGILLRTPISLLYNWCNVLIFDLANQRDAESVAEDKINKPWRPIPKGKITMQQARRLMLVAIPLTMCLNYLLGVTLQGMLIHLVTWLYNDLRGGDEPVLREFLIAVGYAMFNSGSLVVSARGIGQTGTLNIFSGSSGDFDRIGGSGGGSGLGLNAHGLSWTALVSAVIFTTMQIQDLKDQEGDRLRGRQTIVIFLGSRVSRGSIAFFVLFWSIVCAHYWSWSWAFAPVILQATVVAWRVIFLQNQQADRNSWKMWCWWLVLLYISPVTSRFA